MSEEVIFVFFFVKALPAVEKKMYFFPKKRKKILPLQMMFLSKLGNIPKTKDF